MEFEISAPYNDVVGFPKLFCGADEVKGGGKSSRIASRRVKGTRPLLIHQPIADKTNQPATLSLCATKNASVFTQEVLIRLPMATFGWLNKARIFSTGSSWQSELIPIKSTSSHCRTD